MKRSVYSYLIPLLAVLIVPRGYCQEIAPSSLPKDLTSVGDKLYFSADDGVRGRELWVYDSETQKSTIVSDIWPGERGSNPSHFLAFGDKLLFAAESEDELRPGYSLGVELWVSDGSAPGTQLVLNIHPGEMSGFREWVSARDGVAYFEGVTPDEGAELWRTDGTTTGTRLILDLWPGPDGAQPTAKDHGWLPDGRLVFIGFRDAENVLFVFNPRDESFEALKVLYIEANVLRDALGLVFFTTQDTEHGRELWKTDGSKAGTVFVKDINPGARDGNPGPMTVLGDKAYFAATDSNNGTELWVTDGTENGTQLVKDINPGIADSNPYQLTVSGPYIYFAASGQSVGIEIWRTDGTKDGTILLRDINDGQANSNPYALTELAGGVVFGATSSEYGVELWGSDGTEEGTRIIRDIVRGPSLEPSGNPYLLTRHGSYVFFHATTLANGVELWRTDGTKEGTILVSDILKEIRPNASSFPHNLTAVNNTLFFVARDPDHGSELWRTTDSSERVKMVQDIFPGSASSDPHHLTAVGSILYFGADDGRNGNELWRSDGTEEGTRLVQDYAPALANSAPKELTPFRNTLYFVAWNEKDGEELVMVEGVGIHRVKDINPGPASSSPRDLVVVGDGLYFRANNGVNGEELWACFGAEYNTAMVEDILPRTTASMTPTGLTPVDNKLFFAAADGTHGIELWCLEAKGVRPAMVADIARSPYAGVRHINEVEDRRSDSK